MGLAARYTGYGRRLMFRVGQKVVRVYSSDTNTDGIVELVEGRIYTVRWGRP